MPTLKHPPDSNVTTEPPVSSSHCYPEAASTHIYLAVAAVAIWVAIRLAKLRFGPQRRVLQRAPKSEFQEGRDGSGSECRKDSAASYSKRDSAVRSSWEARDQRGVRLSFGRESQQLLRTAGPLPLGVGPGQPEPAERAQAMDGIDEERRKDHSEPSASATSRGVSTSNPSAAGPRHQRNPPPSGARPPSPEDARRGNRSPRSLPQPTPSRHLSGGSDGASDKAFKGKGPMVGHHSWGTRPRSPALGGGSGSQFADAPSAFGGSAQYDVPGALDSSASKPFARPPLPPPLTPPVLSTAAFPFEERRRSYAVSIPPELDTSFMHQPNPDYAGGSTSTDLYSSSPRSATATPRRRSYTKSIPIGIPATSATASSSSETMTSADTFSPSSYPPTSPLLPPPPPGHEFPYEYEFVGGPGGPGVLESYEEVDLHGEIISVTDDAGHGWKRHTRVYGGGVCLACAAAGEEGGFYGDKVPLADRRR
ncbi:hypothetical protein B0T16DRAFT_387742 [Cercophora newfieldiana]|uniref:Uncharacterized protein n=1 Tax=Cercophora newfieldiana TaxID=92897 RepID=A0AA39YH16_9PEZI|nr:hypothetical protein B0T16DRAFT_387742 [Cercophora newfieldiana]